MGKEGGATRLKASKRPKKTYLQRAYQNTQLLRHDELHVYRFDTEWRQDNDI